ncbi:MAG: hypothetical protein IPP88_04010 [Betaproteobacteria bacterium]|nr:hypothetical protein [Betaproteobacteria bacterium]
MIGIAIIAFLSSLSLDSFSATVLAATLCALALYGYALKNYAAEVTDFRGTSVKVMALVLACVAIGIGICIRFMVPISGAILMITAVIAGVVSWRMRKLLRGPAILPAGRLAEIL